MIVNNFHCVEETALQHTFAEEAGFRVWDPLFAGSTLLVFCPTAAEEEGGGVRAGLPVCDLI